MESISFDQLTKPDIIESAVEFVESFRKFASDVPAAVQLKLSKFKEFQEVTGEKCHEAKNFIRLLNESNDLSSTDSYQKVIEIQNIMNYCKTLNDEKLRLAQEILELVLQNTKKVEKSQESFMVKHDPQWKEELIKKEAVKLEQSRTKRSKRRPHTDKAQDAIKAKIGNFEDASNKLNTSYSTRNTSLIPKNEKVKEEIVEKRELLDRNKSNYNKKFSKDGENGSQQDKSVLFMGSDHSSKASSKFKLSSHSLSTPKRTQVSSEIRATPKSSNKPLSTIRGDSSLSRSKKKKKRQVKQAVSPSQEEQVADHDSNEELFCFCQQVSFGNMVCCDGPNCKYEWFHFDCVGLSQSPGENQNWYCPDCKKKYKKSS